MAKKYQTSVTCHTASEGHFGRASTAKGISHSTYWGDRDLVGDHERGQRQEADLHQPGPGRRGQREDRDAEQQHAHRDHRHQVQVFAVGQDAPLVLLEEEPQAAPVDPALAAEGRKRVQPSKLASMIGTLASSHTPIAAPSIFQERHPLGGADRQQEDRPEEHQRVELGRHRQRQQRPGPVVVLPRPGEQPAERERSGGEVPVDVRGQDDLGASAYQRASHLRVGPASAAMHSTPITRETPMMITVMS